MTTKKVRTPEASREREAARDDVIKLAVYFANEGQAKVNCERVVRSALDKYDATE